MLRTTGTTSDERTYRHYNRPEVRAAIQRYTQTPEGWRCLNGDFDHWYQYEGNQKRLNTPEDYDKLISRHKVIYASLDVFEEGLKGASIPKDCEDPLGTFANCKAYSLGVDIDLLDKDLSKLENIEALQHGTQFFIDCLRDHGISRSIKALFSVGGCYVLIDHRLFQAGDDWTTEDRVRTFGQLTRCYDHVIHEIADQFFQRHPEHRGRIKFDSLNNRKRLYKAPFSLHKSSELDSRLLAVIPLDPTNIKIDPDRAAISLKADILAQGQTWYDQYDLNEKDPLKALLTAYIEQVKEEISEHSGTPGDIFRAYKPIPAECWPPCTQNIISKIEPNRAPHRAVAVLAEFLGQVGLTHEESSKIWLDAARKGGIGDRVDLFHSYYGLFSTPICKTIQRESQGFPRQGLGGCGYCEPDELCKCIYWPVEYARLKAKGSTSEEIPKEETAEEQPKGDEISEEELEAFKLPDGPKFECNLPKDHFIQRFIAYGTDISDAYPDYWLAGGLYALAVVADKKLKVVLKQGPVYPNLYVSINGKSSLARKSTAVDKTEAVIIKTLPQMLSAEVPTEFSPEAFIEHLSSYQHAPWIRDEAAGVLSLMKKDYMRGFKDSMMQLFDCKPFHRKLRTSQRKGSQTDFNVDDPYLNLLWATTGASLGANTDQTDTLSGFLARFIFFFPQGMKPRFMPLEEGTPEISMFEDLIISQLQGIAAKMAEIEECSALHLSPDAKAYYNRWQETREREWIATDDGAAMQIFSRLNPMVVKLGMLFELGSADFDISKPIRLEFIEEACRLVDEYLMPTSRAVYDLVGASADKNDIDKIVSFLKQHNGKGSIREIMRYVKTKRKDFDDYVSMMVESEMVDEKTVDNKGKGRNTVYLFLRDNAKVTNVSKVPKVPNVTSVTKIPVSEDIGNSCDTGDVGDIGDIADTGDNSRGEGDKSPLSTMGEPVTVKQEMPTPKAKAVIAEDQTLTTDARGLAIAMYGYNGWVDPSEFARKLEVDEGAACKALEDLGYIRYDRQDGGIGYRQRGADEAKA